eukprot:1143731-Pelagomonas_calceolata.AAC.2
MPPHQPCRPHLRRIEPLLPGQWRGVCGEHAWRQPAGAPARPAAHPCRPQQLRRGAHYCVCSPGLLVVRGKRMITLSCVRLEQCGVTSHDVAWKQADLPNNVGRSAGCPEAPSRLLLIVGIGLVCTSVVHALGCRPCEHTCTCGACLGLPTL